MKITINFNNFNECDIYIKNNMYKRSSSIDDTTIFLRKNAQNIIFISYNFSFLANEEEINQLIKKMNVSANYKITNYYKYQLELYNYDVEMDLKNILYIEFLEEEIYFYKLIKDKLKLIEIKQLRCNLNSIIKEGNTYAVNNLINLRLERQSSFLKNINEIKLTDIFFGKLINDSISVHAFNYLKFKLNKDINYFEAKYSFNYLVIRHYLKIESNTSLLKSLITSKKNIIYISSKKLNHAKILNKIQGR